MTLHVSNLSAEGRFPDADRPSAIAADAGISSRKSAFAESRHSLRRGGVPTFAADGVRLEWPTLLLIAACYAGWFAAGLLYAVAPVAAVALLALAIALHSSLQHEAIHGHPTPWAGVNEVLVGLPLGLLVPYRRYRRQHLAHHVDGRVTDPYDDPESFYVARGDWQRLPRAVQMLLAWNNMLAVRMLIGPLISTALFLAGEAKALARPIDRRDGREVRGAWMLHAAGLAGLAAIVHAVFAMPVGVYLLSVYLASSLLAIRSFCEHRWHAHPGARTVIVERSLLGLLFLNNNLHLVHHTHPGLPWYALPAAYRARRGAWLAINEGYVFRGYGAVLRAFGLRAKEPVPHPVRVSR